MGVLVGGAFLVQFALLLGASNTVIGLIAAIGPLTQILQIPAIYLVDGTGRRKAMTVFPAGAGRLFLLLVAGVPWLVPAPWRIPCLLVGLFMYFGLGAAAGCAWNSWMRDLVPQAIMGSYFSKRLSVATAIGAGASVLAGLAVDRYKDAGPEAIGVYSLVFLVGIGFGLVGLLFLALTPEPRMLPSKSKGLLGVLAEPFRDQNFRRLLLFLASWNFSINLAAPFFTVYLLRNLGLSMAWVIGLSVLSQAVNVVFFRVWGRLTDRYTNKPILGVSGFLFVLSIAVWPFTTMPERYVLSIPLVVLIHVLAGISTAGVAISGGNIALKLAPYGRATSYLAVNGLVCGLAATVAPILAGFGADWLQNQQFRLTLSWLSGGSAYNLPAVNLEGLDFLFVIAVILGLQSLHLLFAVHEVGEVEENLFVGQLVSEMRQRIKTVSSVAGLRNLTAFPYHRLKDMLKPRPAAPPPPAASA
jgi:MFS family permease